MHTDRYLKFILTVIVFGLIANLFVPAQEELGRCQRRQSSCQRPR
ncbi:MAG: hypothetical protein JWN14_1600 [Chthonomonadales bacterium]|nr:hypothetical protein [Chthonomonadales bacterium]